MSCPLCAAASEKVIYLGLPMRLCSVNTCSCLFGFWSFVMFLVPISVEDEYGEPAFAFEPYEGRYLPALWRWLTFREEDE